MKEKKKIYLSFMTTFQTLTDTFHVSEDLFKELSTNFEKIYIINSENLEFPPNKNFDEKKLKEIYKPDNFIFFNPKNFREFNNFLKDKDIIVINNFGKYLNSLKIHFFLKIKKIKMIQISNFGTFTQAPVYDYKNHLYLSIKHMFTNTLFKKIIVILANIGILTKLEIRFLSSKYILDKIEKNPIKNFLYKNKMFYAKKIILINSRSYDILNKGLYKSTEDYIVHLDCNLNWKDQTPYRGRISDESINKHYHYLNKFLSKLSDDFQKKIIVCIHPGYDLEEFKKYFENFSVVKFKTREYIYKSFLVAVFDSSAVTDAILLKKRVIGLTSDFVGINEKKQWLSCANIYGLVQLNIKKDILKNKNIILEETEKKILGYDNYISNYHCFDKKVSGYSKITNTLKKEFF